MTREDKKKIERPAYWHDLLRQLRGTPDFPVKLFFLALFLVGAVYVATKQAILREQVKHIELISPILKAAMEHAVTAYLFVGGLALLTLLLYPFGRRAAKDQLQCIGLINHAGMPPDLLRKRRDKDNPRVTIWEFRNQSIPLQEWEKKCLAIETALGITIVKLAYAKGKSRVLVYSVSADDDLPEVLKWKDSYLSPKSFVLVLGESYTGPVTVNLAHIPHILLGGSTGSGKSVLLKLLRRGFPQGLARKMPDVLHGGRFARYPRPARGGTGTPQERVQGAGLSKHRRLQRNRRATHSEACIRL